MEKTHTKIGPGTKRRQEILLARFKEMLMEEGENARLFPRSHFYEKLADETGYSTSTVQIYIGRALRCNE